MARGLSIALTTILLIGCSDSGRPKLPDPREVAVADSLTAFHALNFSIRDEVIYIKPGEFDAAVPKTLGGKPVEIIEHDELLQKIGSRETAPHYTLYAIGNDRTDCDFYVAISTSSAGGLGQFKEIPWGGGRTYLYTIKDGIPKLKEVETMEF